jgi:hypothetical protein
MCSGSTWALPLAAAMRTAAPTASWAFVVNLMSIGLFLWFFCGTQAPRRRGGRYSTSAVERFSAA